MLQIQDLTFAYSRRQPPVIDNITLSLSPGAVYGLLGPNGAGKSTLLYLIAGLLTPNHGHVALNGIDTRLRLPQTSRQMFLVPEEFDLPKMKMSQYVRAHSPFYPNFSHEDLASNLERFGFPADFDLGALSMGQKKKAFMSFALAANTPLLMMDEPTNGLDIPSKAGFRSFIASAMTDERTIIISTHQVRDIEQLLDHVLIMNSNKLALNASLCEISQWLSFRTTADAQQTAAALCAIPDVGGMQIVTLRGADERETPVNLELLFQLATTRPEVVQQIFSTPNPKI